MQASDGIVWNSSYWCAMMVSKHMSVVQVACLCLAGQVVIYDVHGKIVRNFLLLDVITAVQIVECHFWGNGVVALTSDMQLHVAEV